MGNLAKFIYYYGDDGQSGRHTATGSVVSFTAGKTAPIEVKAAVNFVQDGSGDPSPDNIREITGWTAAHIYVSPTTDAGDGTTYTVKFPYDAGTVYVGELDATGGKLVVTHAANQIKNMDFSATYATTHTNAHVFSSSAVSGIMPKCDPVCSAYATKTWGQAVDAMPDCSIQSGYASSTQSRLFIKDNRYNRNTFNTWLEEVGEELIVYPLDTPVEYTLTAKSIESLAGQNYIWADTGDVTVTFTGDNVAVLDLRSDLVGIGAADHMVLKS